LRADRTPEESIVESRSPGRLSWKPVLVATTAATALVTVVFMIVQGEIIPPVAAFVVLALAGLVLLRVRERSGTIMLAVLSLLFFSLNVPFTVPVLVVPESTVDFLASALILLGLFAMLVSAIATLRRTRADAVRFAGFISVLALIAVAVAIVARIAYDEAVAEPGDIQMALEDFEFSPATIRAEAGEVSVFLDNKDTVLHTFTIEELDVDVDVPGAGSARVTFEATPGTYEFICEPHQPDMDGTLEIGG
jgi:plastocyanin